ncbi:MAG: DNA mismatch repair protein MutS, partial [Nitrospinae bacterium CG11_big_fil_rev_8_21_14_0_20_56_8]
AVLFDELEKIGPQEILVPDSATATNGTPRSWLDRHAHCVNSCEDWTFSFGEAYRRLVEHFHTGSLEGFGCEPLKLGICAAGALLHFLHESQKTALDHIRSLSTFNVEQFMMLDHTTVRSLELVLSSEGTRKNSLLDALDLSLTPMGARRIRDWILKPLVNNKDIDARLDVVELFKDNPMLRQDLRDRFKKIHDLERLLGRISLSTCTARDLVALKTSLALLPELLRLLREASSPAVGRFVDSWDSLDDLHTRIEEQIVDDPPFSLKEGNLIREGRHPELDRLKNISRDGKSWIASLEAKERQRTGIPILKVGFNKIYGYYLEVTKKHAERVPADYIRKQSLVNAERYICPELKKFEEEITSAEEKIADLELKLFHEVREGIASQGERIQHMARTVSEIDALLAFAEGAHRFNYTRPVVDEDTVLEIENGRHPLIERIDPASRFIPNDTLLDCRERQIMIITGPNMAGKSTYLRQVALVALMAQMGSFVPADRARVGVMDRIFSRVGAQDHLQKGQSTFMVEMNETANILNNATARSLIILDEIGRGTSTFDGISIAWSIVEYLHGNDPEGGPKTLFATHYHELTELELVLSGVHNYNVQVKEWNDEIIFLRKIVPGGSDKSYGIQVARLAGLPEKVLARAREVLYNLERSEFDEVGRPRISQTDETEEAGPQQLDLFSDPRALPLIRFLETLHPDEMTPKQALESLYHLGELFRKSKP